MSYINNSKTNFTETKTVLIFKDDGDDIIIEIAFSKDKIGKKRTIDNKQKYLNI